MAAAASREEDLADLIVDAVTGDDRPWWPLLSLLELIDHEVAPSVEGATRSTSVQ